MLHAPSKTVSGTQLWLLLALFGFLIWPTCSHADGFIVVTDGPIVPHHFRFAPLEVRFHHVKVTIENDVATTEVDEEFYNPNGQRLEGTYLFPLPSGAHIDKFVMDINGEMVQAELLAADKARSIYEEIVRKAKDPALLEYVGRDAFKVRIFPIEPNSGKRIKVKYTQLLNTESGFTEYTYPLNTEKFSSTPLNEVSIKVDLKTREAIKNVYCASHTVDLRRDGDRHVVVGFEQKNVRPDTDFKLLYTRDSKAIGINLLSYRADRDDGYYLLMASPGQITVSSSQPKDITFVLDNSGSMAGPKLEQAKKALAFCLANLNPEDRFELIRFSTEVEPLFNELKPASKENVDKAGEFVTHLHATGGTALDEALKKALAAVHGTDGRPYVIVFLTDGQPTVGQTSEDAIVANITHADTATRIFTFGIGNDVNTHLLDRVAEGTHGFSQYVLPVEDIELKVSNFYAKVKEPVLSNLQLSVNSPGIKLQQMYPNKLPDLFNGQMLIAFGRYSGHGSAAL